MGRNRLVMLIDENAAQREELAAMLKAGPLAIVAECGYGVEATALAEETRPEIILASVEEPLARAVQTIRAIRALLPDRPILVYSSLTDMNALRPVLQSGISDFLPQPLQVRDLLRAVEQCMEDPAGAASGTGAGAGTILAVVGAKGGVGKSTIATNIAAALARDTDLKVLLVDLDTRFGDVALMLDIESRFTIADLAAAWKPWTGRHFTVRCFRIRRVCRCFRRRAIRPSGVRSAPTRFAPSVNLAHASMTT